MKRARSGSLRTSFTSAAAAAAAFASAAALLALPAPASASPELRVEGRHFKDAAGRTVILRGVNVAGNSKVPPFTAASDPAIFDPLKAWGMNVVRLLFTWEAYEPSPGVYAEAYLDYYTSAARAAWERGLFVIVDFHQDAFSRFSIGGCGDGFPAWALPPSVTPAEPDNGPACSNWGFRMLSDDAMVASWDAFYADETGARTRYLAMLNRVSAHLAGEPGVVGYDILNEPWGDEVTQIGPLYEDAAVAIREASETAILFVEPRALVSAGNKSDLVKPSFTNVAYAPHFYDGSVLVFKSWSNVRPDEPFDFMRGTAESFGAPLFLGEFGAPAGAGGVWGYMNALYQKLDEGLSSGAQWVYTPGWTSEAKDGWNDEDLSIVDDRGRTRDNFEARPYARRIAGTPTRMRVSVEAMFADNTVNLEWDNDPMAGETEIFVPADTYFGGADISVQAYGKGLSCSTRAPFVLCNSASPGPMRVIVGAKRDAAACGLTGIELLLLLPVGAAAARRRRGALKPSRPARPGRPGRGARAALP